jgi:hypothetical protein
MKQDTAGGGQVQCQRKSLNAGAQLSCIWRSQGFPAPVPRSDGLCRRFGESGRIEGRAIPHVERRLASPAPERHPVDRACRRDVRHRAEGREEPRVEIVELRDGPISRDGQVNGHRHDVRRLEAGIHGVEP